MENWWNKVILMTIPRNLSFLAEGASSTGVLSFAKGGTGLSSLSVGYIPYGNGTGAFNSSSNLYFDGTNLGLGTTGPGYRLDVSGQIRSVTSTATAGYQSGIILTDAVTTTIALGLQNPSGSNLPFLYGNSALGFGCNGAEKMRIFGSGGVSIGNTTDPGAGNLRFSGTSNGIYFGSSALLNDYQTGTFTPVDSSGAGLSITVSYARYTKIGRLVSFEMGITYPITSNTNSANITGFPYNCANDFNGSITYTTAALSTVSYVSGNTTTMFFLTPGLNTTNAQISGAFFKISGSYTV
jgi:hypothetical protein